MGHETVIALGLVSGYLLPWLCFVVFYRLEPAGTSLDLNQSRDGKRSDRTALRNRQGSSGEGTGGQSPICRGVKLQLCRVPIHRYVIFRLLKGVPSPYSHLRTDQSVRGKRGTPTPRRGRNAGAGPPQQYLRVELFASRRLPHVTIRNPALRRAS